MERMRSVLALVMLAGCGVQLGSGGSQTDGSTDTQGSSDAGIDAPSIDARPCTGGDMNVMAGEECLMLFTTTPRSWADANTACMALNARLAILDTASKHTAAKALAGTNNTWIGLTDTGMENQFRWVDPGVPYAYMAWDASEPNNGSGSYEEDCVVIAGARGGDWDDRPCSDQVPGVTAGCCTYAYMCQF